MKLKKVLTILTLVAVITAPSLADSRWRGDIHRFDRQDLPRWRGGQWQHSRHDGRLGWWWIVGGLWYFYPTPVYPYPDPYRPPVMLEESAPVVVAPPAPAQTAPPQAQTSPYWYYCEPSRTYYPYASSCPVPWKQVPATPIGAPQ